MVWRKHAQSSERHEHSVIVHRAIVHGKCPVGEVVRGTGSARVHACMHASLWGVLWGRAEARLV